jgi:hypothetical protein
MESRWRDSIQEALKERKMARLEVFEGTWEELSARAEEFKGCKLRLIVLAKEAEASGVNTNEAALRETAARLFADADNVEREPGKSSSDPQKAAFGEILTEKYRKMGLKL